MRASACSSRSRAEDLAIGYRAELISRYRAWPRPAPA
jgi:hypothetical protein